MNMKIESSSNSIFKNTKKLLTSHDRKKQKRFILEGFRLVSDAVRHGADIEYIIVCDGYDFSPDITDKAYVMDKKLFDEISSTVNSQGIIAVVKYLSEDDRLKNLEHNSIVYLDSVTDPGNMGTILRTCDAMAIDAVVVSKGCVDIYNPKVIRSTMASIFNVPVYFDNGDILPLLSENGYKIIGTFPHGDKLSYETDLTGKTVIVMGNEANGICDKTESFCTDKIKIPMPGNAESLNVGICCGMVLYEQLKQKTNGGV